MATNPAKISTHWQAIRATAPDRFDAYKRHGDADELDALARYVWNIELSKALHPKLHVLEVTFRNQLHNALTALYGPRWFDLPTLLQPNSANKVLVAKQELTRAGKPHGPGQIVASLSFGFWTQLYGPVYDSNIGRRTVAHVFPHYKGPAHLQRSLIAPLLKNARLLRNRVSHFEHIAFDPKMPTVHQEISKLIEWMNPELAEISSVGDDLLSIYGKTWRAYRPTVEDLFG